MSALIVVEPFNGGIASQAVRAFLAAAIAGVVFAAIALLDAHAERLSPSWPAPAALAVCAVTFSGRSS